MLKAQGKWLFMQALRRNPNVDTGFINILNNDCSSPNDHIVGNAYTVYDYSACAYRYVMSNTATSCDRRIDGNMGIITDN
ncbi:MAG: hypothetical protein Kow0096_15930 [Thiohalomonadaceae bacterium]